VRDDRIVAYGRSVGGGAAADLSRDRPVRALALQSTFSSVAAMARQALLPGFLVRDAFDNRRAVADFQGPILLMHGVQDEVIPYEHALSLAAWYHAPLTLLQVLAGEVFDVAVDIRRGSPTFGRWVGIRISADDFRQVFVPEGFAHGFCVLSELAEVFYKCTDFYDPAGESGLMWNDPAIGIEWPIAQPVLSARDVTYAPFTPDRSDFPEWQGVALKGKP